MPNIINNTSGLSWVVGAPSTAYPIDSPAAINNASILQNMLSQLGWTNLGLAALFGNIQNESAWNPARQETGGSGFGLVQWTPPTNLTDVLKVVYPEGYIRTDGTQQVNALIAEYQQTNYAQGRPDGVNRAIERQWYNSTGSRYGFNLPKMDWYDFAHATTGTLDDLTRIFMISYERPAYDPNVNHWQRRVESAKHWYQWLTGHPPVNPGRRFPIYFILKGCTPLWKKL